MLELVRPDSEWEKNKGVLENILLNEILSTSQVYMLSSTGRSNLFTCWQLSGEIGLDIPFDDTLSR
jgi:hypothetical protein